MNARSDNYTFNRGESVFASPLQRRFAADALKTEREHD